MSKSIALSFIAVSILSLSSASALAAEPGTLSLTTGVDYSTGKYGGTDVIKITTVSAELGYEIGNYNFSLLLPYVRQTGPSGTVLIGGKVINLSNPSAGSSTKKIVTSSGQGDVAASVTRSFGGEENSPLFEVKGIITFGTANSDDGLGTGQNDYSIQSDVTQTFDKWTLAAGLGYTATGKISAVRLNNVFYGSVDAAYGFDEKTKGGLTLNTSQAYISGASAPLDLTTYYAYNVTKESKIQVYINKGLSNGSADWSTGLTGTFEF